MPLLLLMLLLYIWMLLAFDFLLVIINNLLVWKECLLVLKLVQNSVGRHVRMPIIIRTWLKLFFIELFTGIFVTEWTKRIYWRGWWWDFMATFMERTNFNPYPVRLSMILRKNLAKNNSDWCQKKNVTEFSRIYIVNVQVQQSREVQTGMTVLDNW